MPARPALWQLGPQQFRPRRLPPPFFPPPAGMYIDPGAGSLLFQVIAAGAVGVLASVGRIRRAIADFFAKLRGR